LSTCELFRGTLARTSVYPREVVKTALAPNAAAMIFAHNHPSGIAEPSRADDILVQALEQALAVVDVRALLDAARATSTLGRAPTGPPLPTTRNRFGNSLHDEAIHAA